MKYEIEIVGTDAFTLLEVLAGRFHKFSITPIHEIYGKQSVLAYSSKPSFTRAEIIEEKWRAAATAGYCYCISPRNEIRRITNFESSDSLTTDYVFAPDFNLAEEIVQIREGKWRPRKGDMIYCDVKGCVYGEKAGHDYGENQTHHMFPSPKQLERFNETLSRIKSINVTKVKIGTDSQLDEKPDTYYYGDYKATIEHSKQRRINPNICMNRAKDDEMTFVLLGRDPAMPVAIRAWIDERIRLGKNTEQDTQIINAKEIVIHLEASQKQ